jgi:hypothetical protein
MLSPARTAGKWQERLLAITELALKALNDLIKHNGTFPSRAQPLRELNFLFQVTTSDTELSANTAQPGVINLFIPLTINPPADDEFVGAIEHTLMHMASEAHEDEKRMIAALVSHRQELAGEAYGTEEEWVLRCERAAAHLWMAAGKRPEHKQRYLELVNETEILRKGLPDMIADTALPVIALRLRAFPLLRYCVIADAKRLEKARMLMIRIKDMRSELMHTTEGMTCSSEAANLVGYIASLYTLPYDTALLGHVLADKKSDDALAYSSGDRAELAMLRNDLDKLDTEAAKVRFELFRVCDNQGYEAFRAVYGDALQHMASHARLDKDVRMQRFVESRLFDGDVIGKLKQTQIVLFKQFDRLYNAVAGHAEGRRTPFQSLKKVETLRRAETLRKRDEDSLGRLAELAGKSRA